MIINRHFFSRKETPAKKSAALFLFKFMVKSARGEKNAVIRSECQGRIVAEI